MCYWCSVLKPTGRNRWNYFEQVIYIYSLLDNSVCVSFLYLLDLDFIRLAYYMRFRSCRDGYCENLYGGVFRNLSWLRLYFVTKEENGLNHTSQLLKFPLTYLLRQGLCMQWAHWAEPGFWNVQLCSVKDKIWFWFSI